MTLRMNRRELLRRALPAAGVTLLLPHVLMAGEKSAKKTALVVTPVTDTIQLITGAGGNVTVFNSPEGVLLVDGGSPERSAELLKLVKKTTGASRVHTLFNTHWHWEQTGSNRTLGRAGTRIIAHENTKLWLTTDVDSKWQNRVFAPLPKEAWPNNTFYAKESLTFGGEEIEYGHLPQAHTDGDIYVHFKKANVLVTGDVLTAGSYPFSDYVTGGWVGGMVNATQTLLGLANADTKLIPGTGPVQSRADLEAENTMLVAMKTRLAKLLAAGSSVQDMLDAAPTKEYDARWGDPTLFISNAWPGLVARSRELGVSIV
jgi:cyclase